MFRPLLLSSLLHNSLSVLLSDAQLLGLGPGYTFRLRQGFSEISGFGLAGLESCCCRYPLGLGCCKLPVGLIKQGLQASIVR